jgi:hypothetical protein
MPPGFRPAPWPGGASTLGRCTTPRPKRTSQRAALTQLRRDCVKGTTRGESIDPRTYKASECLLSFIGTQHERGSTKSFPRPISAETQMPRETMTRVLPCLPVLLLATIFCCSSGYQIGGFGQFYSWCGPRIRSRVRFRFRPLQSIPKRGRPEKPKKLESRPVRCVQKPAVSRFAALLGLATARFPPSG